MASSDAASVQPYRIDFTQSDPDDLNQRLDRKRWPDELLGVDWAYGVPRDYREELVRTGGTATTGVRRRRG